jgi:peptidoglycan/LPS O-acetylase OafA/YrhL
MDLTKRRASPKNGIHGDGVRNSTDCGAWQPCPFFLPIILYTLLDPQWGYPHGLLGIPRDGFAAVDLFFVLSGFVLSRSLLASHEGYVSFVIRRVFRLYPAYWAALIISALLFWIHSHTHPVPSNLPFWTQPITVGQAIKHFFMNQPRYRLSSD